MIRACIIMMTTLVVAAAASGQMGPPLPGTPAPVLPGAGTDDIAGFNPVQMLEDGADALPGFEGGLSGALNVMVLLTLHHARTGIHTCT